MAYLQGTKVIFFLSLSMLLTACGGKRIESEFTGGQAEVVASTKEEAKNSFQNFYVRCEDKDNCPQNVANMLIMSKNRQKTYVCTSFLVAQDKMMTNSHCVEEFQNGESCKGLVKFIFPDGEEKEVGCENIIKVSNRKVDLDYALIQLPKALTREPLKLNTEGVVDEGHHSMYSVHTTGGTSARIVYQEKCIAVQKSIAYPNFKDKTSAHVLFADCHNQQGYSGSAILNSRGEVVAINSQILDIDDFRLKFDRDSKYLYSDPLTHYMKGENLHCMSIPGIQEQIPDHCKGEFALEEREEADTAYLRRDEVLEKRIRETNSLYINLHHTTKFEVAEVTENKIATLVPTCIKDPKIWEAEYRNLLTILGLKSRKRDRLEIPVFDVEYGFNKYYQMDYKVKIKDTLEAKYRYPIKKISDTKNEVKYRMKVKSLRLRSQLMNVLYPIFWFFPIKDDTREDWVTIFEKEIPRC